MNFLVNQILQWQSNESEFSIMRILWINHPSDIVTIELQGKALPVWQKYEELEAAFAAKDAHVLEIEPYTKLLSPTKEFLEKYREYRNRAWEVISPIIESGCLAFIPEQRGRLIEAAAALERPWRKPSRKLGTRTVSKLTIYEYLRHYWQRGQTINALLPLYDECGGRGKERITSKQEQCRRGRPNKITLQTGQKIGINVTQHDKRNFTEGIKKFYLNRQQVTLVDAFQRTLEEYYNLGYQYKNAKLIPILPPEAQLPTIGQFRYWYEKEFNITKVTISRQGERKFLLENRAVLGDSSQIAFGPGSQFQIDATIGDLYLVSCLDRTRIIGRPVIYLVVDTFSRMIVGCYVGLEGPSWLGMMMALENAFADKVEFCKTLGIEITEADWPCRELCEALIGDRAELISRNADNLADSSLSIRVDNTPPYRPDWKPIVEKSFDLTQDKYTPWVPGAVRKSRERGEKDYRLDAQLDIFQFRKLMVYIILNHNNCHYLDGYPLDEYMIRDHVQPYPIDLWNWGIENRNGHLRTMAPEIIRLNLLPSAEASVTERGIYFYYAEYKLGLYYTCERAASEQWFVKARMKGRWKITIAYDPRDLTQIYLRPRGCQKLEPCHLLPRSKMFRGRNFYEVADYFALKEQSKLNSRIRERQGDAELYVQMNQIISEGKEQTAKDCDGQSNNARIKGIRANRKENREHQRQIEAWRLGTEESSAQLIPIQPTNLSEEDKEDEEYIARPKNIEMFSELSDRSLNQ